MFLRPHDFVLFQGDSITDAFRKGSRRQAGERRDGMRTPEERLVGVLHNGKEKLR